MFKRKPKVLTPAEMEEIRTKDFFDMILPGTVKFLSDHYIPVSYTHLIDALCSRGFTVEVAKSQQVFAAQNEEASLTMGGLT